MQFIALQNLNQQNMIRLAAFISTGELFGFDLNRRLAVIERCAQQLIDMVLICIDTGDRPVVLNTDGNHSAVSIGKSNQMNCKRLGINTAAEIIYDRADSTKLNMGLTTWKNAPRGRIRKSDVSIAKNYLDETEMRNLNEIVTMYLAPVKPVLNKFAYGI